MIEAPIWIDGPRSPLIPIFDPRLKTEPERVEFAYSERQREWYRRVYQNKCHFPRYDEGRGFFICGVNNKNEVHHITPTAWIRGQLPHLDPNSLDFDNGLLGILLCHSHHDDVIHPDIGGALTNYWQDKEGIKRTVENHKTMAMKGVIFWNNEYDDTMKYVAEQAIHRYMAYHPHDVYPDDAKWAKGVHPAERRWEDEVL